MDDNLTRIKRAYPKIILFQDRPINFHLITLS